MHDLRTRRLLLVSLASFQAWTSPVALTPYAERVLHNLIHTGKRIIPGQNQQWTIQVHLDLYHRAPAHPIPVTS